MFKMKSFNVKYSAFTFLVEILIYSRYILQLERTPCTPYTTAGLEIIPQMDGDWNTCYRQTRLQSTRKVDHGLLQKLPSSFLFLDRPWFGRSCWMANDTSFKVLKKYNNIKWSTPFFNFKRILQSFTSICLDMA